VSVLKMVKLNVGVPMKMVNWVMEVILMLEMMNRLISDITKSHCPCQLYKLLPENAIVVPCSPTSQASTPTLI